MVCVVLEALATMESKGEKVSMRLRALSLELGLLKQRTVMKYETRF